jgi:predicted Na+-dependent transporter
MAIVYEVADPSQGSYFVLILYLLCAFAGLLMAPFVLIMRFTKGHKYRRRFVYTLTGTSNLFLGIISLPYSLTLKIQQIPAEILTGLALLAGLFILYDIFFGKREKKTETEYLTLGE